MCVTIWPNLNANSDSTRLEIELNRGKTKLKTWESLEYSAPHIKTNDNPYLMLSLKEVKEVRDIDRERRRNSQPADTSTASWKVYPHIPPLI